MFKNVPAWLKLVIKIIVTAACLWYVIKKIDWTLSWHLLQQSTKWWLMIALVLVAVSKVVSSFRLNIYFNNIGIFLKIKNQLQLYWLGMFYNLFLPGGIGGDAYKVILLNKKYADVPAKKIGAAVLLDRLSGVVALGILAVGFYWLVFRGDNYSTLLLIAILPGLIVYYFAINKIFPSFKAGFYPVLSLGFLVQLLQVVAVYCIMFSTDTGGHFSELQLLFLLSSVATMLPITIGPFGARQAVFLWGAKQFNLNITEAVYISLLFDLMQMLVALIGGRWMYKNALEE
jgi:uncharacterized membrane protein YbhN (UPF0104 family)